MMGPAEETVRTTCPRDCYDACGIHVVKRDGVILKVMGDPTHPHNRGTLCGKCTLAYNGAWRDPQARLLHPAEAASRGLTEGAPVIVWSEAGRLPLSVAISDEVPRGVALIHKGRWPKLDPSHANVNVLTTGRKGDMGESSSVHSVEVEIARAV